MSAPKPRAYRLRDYDDAIATLGELRTNRGITLTELGDAVNGTRQQVTTWLRGQHEPGARRLFGLADALGYDLALIPREDTP